MGMVPTTSLSPTHSSGPGGVASAGARIPRAKPIMPKQAMMSARHVGGAIPPQGYLVRQMGGESKVWCLLDMSVEQYHLRVTWYVRWGVRARYGVC